MSHSRRLSNTDRQRHNKTQRNSVQPLAARYLFFDDAWLWGGELGLDPVGEFNELGDGQLLGAAGQVDGAIWREA